MLLIQRPEIKAHDEESGNKQRFLISPLEPGFGHTLGNSLRRTLLSAIPGAAITHVLFDNAIHEFDVMEGVIEDVPDIFHVGHVHKAQLDMYKGILLVNSGSWQKQTPFQASVGMVPNPGLAIIVNLKTLQVFHENYSSDSNNILQS